MRKTEVSSRHRERGPWSRPSGFTISGFGSGTFSIIAKVGDRRRLRWHPSSFREKMPPPMQLAISCHDLKKHFGTVKAVDGLDLEISAGECFGLLGPNGAGKTTTIEILE